MNTMTKPDKAGGASKTVLLVEDDESDIMLVRRSLAKHSGSILLEVARDGEEALALLRSDRLLAKPKIIVTDLNMPGMSGHEFMSAVRADEKLAGAVIFVLSSSDLSEDVRAAYAHNAAGYLVKRMQPEHMERSMAALLDFCEVMTLPEG